MWHDQQPQHPNKSDPDSDSNPDPNSNSDLGLNVRFAFPTRSIFPANQSHDKCRPNRLSGDQSSPKWEDIESGKYAKAIYKFISWHWNSRLL